MAERDGTITYVILLVFLIPIPQPVSRLDGWPSAKECKQAIEFNRDFYRYIGIIQRISPANCKEDYVNIQKELERRWSIWYNISKLNHEYEEDNEEEMVYYNPEFELKELLGEVNFELRNYPACVPLEYFYLERK